MKKQEDVLEKVSTSKGERMDQESSERAKQYEAVMKQVEESNELYEFAIEQFKSTQKSYRFLTRISMVMCVLAVMLVGCVLCYYLSLL